jgi:uncharacterized damage-inducible protein DinB
MSENSDNLARYVNYNIWANKAIADFLVDKDQNLLDKEIISSFSSIRKTIFHIADAQHIWIQRLKGTSPSDWPSKTMRPDEAITSLINTSMLFALHCENKSDSFWNEVISFATMDGTQYKESVANIIMHVNNHSTFHRGQLITMFRQVGFEGKMPRTDLIAYLRELDGK